MQSFIECFSLPVGSFRSLSAVVPVKKRPHFSSQRTLYTDWNDIKNRIKTVYEYFALQRQSRHCGQTFTWSYCSSIYRVYWLLPGVIIPVFIDFTRSILFSVIELIFLDLVTNVFRLFPIDLRFKHECFTMTFRFLPNLFSMNDLLFLDLITNVLRLFPILLLTMSFRSLHP